MPYVTRRLFSGRTRIAELWREFFKDPSQWLDNRPEKVNPRYPDFKHRRTRDSLWLINRSNPPWVEAELAAVTPGTLQVDVFTWNRRLAKYVKSGQHRKALQHFQQMQREGMNPDRFTFVPVLSACSGLQDLQEGRRIHTQVIEHSFVSDLYVGNSLVDMYAKCGTIKDARKVFEDMPTRDVVTWSALILGYVKCGQGQQALKLFHQMQQEGPEPNAVTFVGVLNACASIAALEEGRDVHKQIIQTGLESDVFVATSLVDMYGKCRSLEDAKRVFTKIATPSVVSWNAMLTGYIKCGSMEDACETFDKMPTRDLFSWNSMIQGFVNSGQGHKALELYRQMTMQALKPDSVTFVGLLTACASEASLEEGRRIHEQIIESCSEDNVFVANSLVDMYAKCGSVEDARRVFDKMSARDVVAWSALILGYVKCGHGKQALELFRQMQRHGPEPNSVTFVGVLNACASVAALEEGMGVHNQIIEKGYDSDIFVANSLIDMYAKCGSLKDARKVFSEMSTRDVVAWNAMLAGYAAHGYAKEAIQIFQRMPRESVQTDGITFISLLSACSHAGWVDEGVQLFESMFADYHVLPTVEHYACLVDLLGRAGCLHEADDLIISMSCEPNLGVWKALLGACRIHENMEVGERAAKRVLELDPKNAVGYVLLSNIYAAAGKWDTSSAIHGERLERG